MNSSSNISNEPRPLADSGLSSRTAGLLAGLRRCIRFYVWAEGIALVVIWLGLTFWAGLALDYLPVLVGASEMPIAARFLLLVLIAVILAWILYRWVLRRVFHRLQARSMALLLERQFPEFQDSLMTSVELAESTSDGMQSTSDGMQSTSDGMQSTSDSGQSTSDSGQFNADMLAHTRREAEAHIGAVKLRKVFNYYPLLRNVIGAVLAVGSIILLGLMSRDALAHWAARLYLLSDEPWPRKAHIEVMGFPNGSVKVARGTDLTLQVRADAERHVLPELCTIHYTTAAGDRGRVNMSRDGEPRDGYQHYVFRGKPFKGMLEDISFDVVGYDHRVRDRRVEVVLSPVIVDVQLACELPSYTGLLPRQETWHAGTQLPVGTKVTAVIRASKDLKRATTHNPDTGETVVTEFDESSADRRAFEHRVPRLENLHTVLVTLEDTDAIVSQEPHRIAIGGIVDQPPRVNILLRGIGTAITADARIPPTGEITDDYEVVRAWFEVQALEGERREFPFPLASGGKVDAALDLRAQRAATENRFEVTPGDKIVFSVKAADRYDLDGAPQIGASDTFELDVVRPDELLAVLDGRELGLRRRFEQIKTEMTDTRDSLIRARASEPSLSEQDSPIPDEATQDTQSPSTDAAPEGISSDSQDVGRRNFAETRQRLVEWAIQHARRATQEVAGVATAFEDIRDELINNRLDTQERKERLQEQLVEPLQRIAEQMFPEFEATLARFQTQLARGDAQPPEAALVVEQADQILLAMDQILQRMIELGDYADLVNIVRSILQDQERLIDQTKEEQRQRALELLK